MSAKRLSDSLSLRRKVLHPLLLAALVSGALALWLIQTTFDRHVVVQLRNRAELVAQAANAAAEHLIGPRALQEVVRAWASHPEVTLVVVAGGRPARVLASTRSAWVGLKVTELEDPHLKAILAEGAGSPQPHLQVDPKGRDAHYRRPLRLGPGAAGAPELADGVVVVRLDTRAAFAGAQSDAWDLSAATLGLIGVVALFGYWRIRSQVLQPVERLANTFEPAPAIATSGPEATPPPHHDLFGQLEWRLRQALHEVERTSAALRISEERFKGVFNHSPVAITLLSSPDRRFVEINHAGLQLFGYTPDEMIGRTSLELELWVDLADRARYLAELNAHGHVSGFETLMRRKSGEVFAVVYSGTLVEIGGQPYSLNSMRDITGRRRAEQALRESEQRLAYALDATDDGLWDWNIATGEVHFSPRWNRLLGFQPGEVPARVESFFPLVHPDDLEHLRQELNDHLEGRKPVKQTTARLRTKSGEYRWFLDRGKVVVRDSEGRPLRMVGTITDVTERKKAEAEQLRIRERLHQNQKLEALGTLAGGIAHDFNNILTAITICTTLAKDECVPGVTRVPEYCNEILKSAGRAKELIRQIQLVGRPESGERRPIELQTIVTEVVSLLRSTAPPSVDLRSDFGPGPHPIVANATQIHQVVMNLAINAIHALQANGGSLTFRLAGQRVEAPQEEDGAELRPGDYIRLGVEDTGSGMEPAVLSRIFEPFFTTKKPGEGSGLGLAVVRGIVRGHGGFIGVRSTPGKGTSITVWFPRGEPHPVGPSSAPAEQIPRGQGQRLLFVDDEIIITRSMQRLLENLGYHVTTFNNPLLALTHLSKAPAEVDLLMTDFQMPEMMGNEVAKRARAIRPGLPVILSSGFASNFTEDQLVAEGVGAILHKPYEARELATLLIQMLPPAARSQPSAAPEPSGRTS
ncbi:MAG TPA: PAS domain S-box protein [Opitutaceae bacterium]|nr:PAS domain S-box protein [Opitutaceae bacterium]